MPSQTEAVIICHKINTFRGPVHALRDVTLTVNKGITCLVGPNGAGKTTLLKSMMGLLRVTSGTITFKGRDITNIKTSKIAGLGIGYVPEDRRIYPDFSVRENILLGTWRRKIDKEAMLDKVYALFPQLKELSRSMGLHLSGGEKGMLSIARTLALDPSCLLLDEPLEGLAPAVRKDLTEKIVEFRAEGMTAIITASDLSYVPEIADMTYSLDRGEIVGPPPGPP